MQTLLLSPPLVTRPVLPGVRTLPVYVRSAVLPTAAYCAAKRLVDVVFAATLVVVFSPIFLIVSLLIKVTDGGAVFFRQQRVGLDGIAFWFYKFRSMVPDAEERKSELAGQNKHHNSITFKMLRDPA